MTHCEKRWDFVRERFPLEWHVVFHSLFLQIAPQTEHGLQLKYRIMYRMLFAPLECFPLCYEASELHKFTLISVLLPPHMLRTLLPMERKYRQDFRQHYGGSNKWNALNAWVLHYHARPTACDVQGNVHRLLHGKSNYCFTLFLTVSWKLVQINSQTSWSNHASADVCFTPVKSTKKK